jgi:hypothetical protein
MKYSQVLPLVCTSFLISQCLAFHVLAGGGGDPNAVVGNSTQQPALGTGIVATPSTLLNSVNQVQQTISPAVQPLTTQPIQPLQNSQSYYNSTTTQYGNAGYANQCGISISSGVTNANTTLQLVYDARVTYNTNPCPNYNKVEEEKRKAQIQETKMYTTGNVLNTCINARAQAVQTGKDPDKICLLPNMSLMQSLLGK